MPTHLYHAGAGAPTATDSGTATSAALGMLSMDVCLPDASRSPSRSHSHGVSWADTKPGWEKEISLEVRTHNAGGCENVWRGWTILRASPMPNVHYTYCMTKIHGGSGVDRSIRQGPNFQDSQEHEGERLMPRCAKGEHKGSGHRRPSQSSDCFLTREASDLDKSSNWFIQREQCQGMTSRAPTLYSVTDVGHVGPRARGLVLISPLAGHRPWASCPHCQARGALVRVGLSFLPAPGHSVALGPP